MEKILFVVAGGELNDPLFFRSKVKELNPVGIVCADSGARHLHETV
jgi:thiamine pyrophosphokinase